MPYVREMESVFFGAGDIFCLFLTIQVGGTTA